jgi:hypothetical protein
VSTVGVVRRVTRVYLCLCKYCWPHFWDAINYINNYICITFSLYHVPCVELLYIYIISCAMCRTSLYIYIKHLLALSVNVMFCFWGKKKNVTMLGTILILPFFFYSLKLISFLKLLLNLECITIKFWSNCNFRNHVNFDMIKIKKNKKKSIINNLTLLINYSGCIIQSGTWGHIYKKIIIIINK